MSHQLPESQPPGTRSLELSRYWTILRRRRLLILLGGLLGLATAVTYLYLTPTTATATTLVNVNVITAEPFNNSREPSGLIDPQTEVQTARSSAVVTRTAEALGGDLTPSEVRAGLDAELEPDATVLRISYQADDPESAVAGADEAARQFLVYRGELAEDKVRTISDQLTQRRDLLRDDLLRVNEQLSNATEGSRRAVQAESDRQLLNLELNSLLEQANAMQGIDTSGGAVLTSAVDVGAVVTPNRGVVLIAALLAGLLLGVIAALARHALGARLHESFEVLDHGAGPVLARLGDHRSTTTVGGEDLDEARSARERLLATLPQDRQVLAIMDVASLPGPSEVAVDIALAESESGRSVELVLAAFPDRALQQVVRRLKASPAGGARRLGAAARPDTPSGLVVSPVGEEGTTVDAATLLRSHLAGGQRDVETTIIAVPPSAARATRLAAGRIADASVLVVVREQTHKAVLRQVVGDLDAVGARIAGTVLLDPSGNRREVPESARVAHDENSLDATDGAVQTLPRGR